MVKIRRAVLADVPVLIDLMREFYAESGYSLDTQWANSAFVRLLEDPRSGCAWVAWHDESPLGHAVLTLRYTMEHGALSGYIDDLFVRPEHRRAGVARALLSELTAECARRDCRAIYVEVGDDNEPALHLYVQLGLKRFEDGRVLLGGNLSK